MILSGRLTDWSVADLLQILRITEKTASLRVEGPERGGTLYFDQGRIVDGALTTGARGETARDRIVETVYLLQLLPDGTFAVGTEASPAAGEGMEVPEALEAAERHLAAERELAEAGIGADVLRLTPQVEGPVTLPAEDWATLTQVAGSFTIASLEASLGRARAVAFVTALRRLGLVDPMEDGARHEERVEPPATPSTDDADPALSSWWINHEDADAAPQGEASLAPGAEVIELERLDESLTPERRREMRALITPPDTTLVPGVLGDLRARFRSIDQRS